MPKVTKQRPRGTKKRIGGIAGRIESLDELNQPIRLNLYGRSGTGKTTLWATFPKPILALVCSGGSCPGELRSIDTPENRKTIQKLVVQSSSDIGEAVDYQASSSQFATVVLDHATGLQDIILKEILGIEEIPAQLSWGLATQQQYGQVALQVKERLRSLLSISNIEGLVIVAQEREFNTDQENSQIAPYVASALTPSIVGWLNPACDYIAQTFIRPRMEEKEITLGKKTRKKLVRGKGVEYCLRVAPDEVYTTKFRVPGGIDADLVIVDPTYEKILALIQGRSPSASVKPKKRRVNRNRRRHSN